ncbi:MAG: type II secretion system protein N [Spongiibacteraceae bacterium]
MQAGRLPIWRSAIDNPQPLARALCIGVATVLVGLELWPALSVYVAKPTASPSRAIAAPRDAASVEQITSAELFGHNASQNANLPQTTLQVTLRAVFAASDPKLASAVIESSDGRTQVVKVGGTVDASTTLQGVYPNRVVLLRNGAQETLFFPAPQESSSLPYNALAGTPGQSAPDTAAAGANPGMPTDEIKRAAIMQRLEELRARSPR